MVFYSKLHGFLILVALPLEDRSLRRPWILPLQVLVHCEQGKQRSAAVCCAYLIWWKGFSCAQSRPVQPPTGIDSTHLPPQNATIPMSRSPCHVMSCFRSII